ncbi:MAG: TonB-dependent receptor [Polyangiaceae bacterium]
MARALSFCVAVLCALPQVAFAADPPDATQRPQPTPVTAPKPKVTTDVPYPFDGEGDADVVLTLLISDAGNVREIRAAEGSEPFVGQARASVARWTYEPAERGGVKIAALIRVLVHFEAPVVKKPGRSLPDGPIVTGDPADAKSPPNGRPEAATEVSVRGNRAPAPHASQLGKSEVRQLPGAFGDPFRAIDVLPGLVPTISGLPFYYIRGAPPSNVGYYLDGVRVPYLFHFGLGPSVVHPALVDRVVLYPGAPPEHLGRFAGAYITADGAPPRKFAEANLRLVDVGAIAETSILNDRLYVLAGGRFSYTAALLSLFAPDITLDYRDYQARVTYKVTDHDDVRAFLFGGSDFVVQDQEDDRSGQKSVVRNVFFASEFHRGDLRYRHHSETTDLEAGFTVGFDSTRLEGRRYTRDYLVAGRARFMHVLDKHLSVRGGLDVTTDTYRADLPSEYATSTSEYATNKSFLQSRLDTTSAIFGGLTWKPLSRVEFNPGLRLELFTSGGKQVAAADPRLSATVHLSKKQRFVFAHGLTHQPPAFPIPVPAVSIAGLPKGLQGATQTSVGIEADLPQEFSLGVTAWKASFRDTNDFFAAGGSVDLQDNNGEVRTGGYAIGLETQLKRRLSRRVGGMIAYTLSRNMRYIDGHLIESPFDRTNVLNVALSFDLGKNWRAGSRFLFYSGWPRTDEARRRVGSRLPDFYRIDARVEKRWKFSHDRWLALVFEGLNVTLSKDVIDYKCDERGCRPQTFGPVAIPSIGLEGGL